MGQRASRERTESQTNRRYGMRRIGAIALVLWTGLACAMSAQAKPKHQPLKCKAGYTRGTVRIAKRVHGRIVRRHGRIVYIKVQRCVKTPRPKPSSPATACARHPHDSDDRAASGDHDHAVAVPDPLTHAAPRRPRRRRGGGHRAASRLIPATPAGRRRPRRSHRHSEPHLRLRARRQPVRLGLVQRVHGLGYDLTWGQDFNSIVHPVPGNHEYLTSGRGRLLPVLRGPRRHDQRAGRLLLVQPRQLAHRRAQLQLLRPAGCSDALAGGTTSAADVVAAVRSCGEPERVRARDVASPVVLLRLDARHPERGAAVERALQRPRGRRARTDTTISTSATRNRIRPATRSTAGIREFVVGTGGESLNGLNGSTPPATLQAHDSASTACSCSRFTRAAMTGSSSPPSGTDQLTAAPRRVTGPARRQRGGRFRVALPALMSRG